MSDSFLSTFMQVAKQITHAERCMSVTPDLSVVEIHNLDADILQSDEFQEIATKCLSKAIETNVAVLTNNIITDPSQAPVTNTNFSDLRVIVAIPVKGSGAIYLDQHIRNGMFQRETIERLNRLASQVVASGDDLPNAEELHKIYEQMD